MNRPHFVAATLALIALLGARPAAAQSASELQGVVTDASTGAPVSGVAVALCAPYTGGCFASPAVTDGNGAYTLTGDNLGSLTQGTLYFSKPSYFTHVAVFTINTTLNVALTSGGPVIQGHVTDSTTGTPLANAQVIFQSAAFLQISGTVTDASGQYVFDSSYFRDTAADGFTITQSFAQLSGYFGSSDTTAFAAAPPYPLTRDFSLQPASGIALHGIVTDASTGQPISGVTVAMCAPYTGGCFAAPTVTDGNGAYSLTGVDLALQTQGTLYFFKTAYFTHVATFAVNTTLNVALTSGGPVIQGHVTDSTTGTPLANAQVIFQSAVFLQISGTVTDASGQYVFDSSYFRDTAAKSFTVSQSGAFANGYFTFTDTTGFAGAPPYPLTKDFVLTWNGTQFAVVVTTSPSGLPITVDGVSYTSPQSFTWKPSAPHVIATEAIVDDGPGSRNVFAGWSDGGAISHTVWIGQSSATFTAFFGRQYLLTVAATPPAGGTVAGGGWYAGSSAAQVSAIPNPGYMFAGYTGDLSASTSPQTVVMNSPKSITANFMALIATTTSFAVTPNPTRVGQVVTLAATVTPAIAGGSVTFFDNGFPIGTATTDASGVAQLVTSTLTQGTHPLSAGYMGDLTHSPSNSTVVSEIVQAATFPQVALTSAAIDFGSLPVFQSTTAPTFATGAVRSLHVAAGDFNRDGAVDLAVLDLPDEGPGTVKILLGDGEGGFAHVADLTTGLSPSGIAVVDVNHDGALDVVTGSQSETAVRVFLGDGSGGFAASTPWAAGGSPAALTTGDFNGDGNIDIATANTNGTIGVLMGDGNGLFSAPLTYPGGNLSITTADLDGDGLLDLVTGFSWLHGNGDGTFAAPILLGTNGSVAVADFNGDGIPDVAVISDQGTPHVSILYGSGAGRMSAMVNIPLGFTPSTIAAADMNGDGLADLVIVSVDYESSIAVLLSSRSGFEDPVLYGLNGDPEGFAIADVNGDGRPDLALTNLRSNLFILANKGDGSLQSSRAVLLDNTGTGALDFSSVSITGADAASFFLEANGCRGTLNVGSTCTIIAGFRPQTAGPKSATLEIVDNSPTSPHEIALTGTATPVTPTITWPAPTDIVYGTVLDATQLDATATLPGTFSYTPAAGTLLGAGANQTLHVDFTPADSANYLSASKDVSITVDKAAPIISITGGPFDYDGLAHPAIVTVVGGAGEALAPSLVTYNGQVGTPIGAGTYTVIATFGGDANNLPASASGTLVINQAGTNVTLTSAPDGTSVFGESVTLTASVTSLTSGGTPTGDVTFTADGSTIGTATLNGATASIAISSLEIGGHTIGVSYQGDSNFLSSSAAPLVYVVNQAAVSVALAANPNPSGLYSPTTLTAVVAPVAPGAGVPIGTVEFFDGSTLLGSAPVTFDGTNASAALSTSFQLSGDHTLTATYPGDAHFLGAQSPAFVQTVNDAASSTTTTLATSADTVPSGSAVTLTATVTALAGKGTPTGQVEFFDGIVSLGIAPLASSGGKTIASLTTSALATGAHTLVAQYPGDSNVSASTSGPVVVTVYDSAAPPTSTTSITSSPNPSAAGEAITITAVVNGQGNAVPGGSVQFYADGLMLGTSALQLVKHDMTATLTVDTLALGEHTLTVVYVGDGTVAGSSSAALLQCVGCTLPKKIK